jgi:glycosyltransferase involved in cell wall biosynthesis
MKKKVSVIIPTYNESATIVKLIRETKKLERLFPVEIIVVDANSPDGTAGIAEKEKVKVIKRTKKYGKGADFWLASQKATGSYVVQIDGDLQFSPKEIPHLVAALENGADVALAWRVSHKGAPFIRTLGNHIFAPIATVLIGKRIHDVVAGFKGFRRDALRSLNLQEKHFGYEGEIVVKAVRMGYRIAQVPVSYQNRTTGKSQVNPLRDGSLTIWSLLKARFAELPEKKHL